MSAFLISKVTVKDNEKFKLYAQYSAKTFKPYNAKILIKGKYYDNYSNSDDHSAASVIEFPSLEAIDQWYNSQEYQSLIVLRDESAEIIFTRYTT